LAAVVKRLAQMLIGGHGHVIFLRGNPNSVGFTCSGFTVLTHVIGFTYSPKVVRKKGNHVPDFRFIYFFVPQKLLAGELKREVDSGHCI